MTLMVALPLSDPWLVAAEVVAWLSMVMVPVLLPVEVVFNPTLMSDVSSALIRPVTVEVVAEPPATTVALVVVLSLPLLLRTDGRRRGRANQDVPESLRHAGRLAGARRLGSVDPELGVVGGQAAVLDVVILAAEVAGSRDAGLDLRDAAARVEPEERVFRRRRTAEAVVEVVADDEAKGLPATRSASRTP